jgi:uncharacterized membrane protein YkvA (DUF1232 family)
MTHATPLAYGTSARLNAMCELTAPGTRGNASSPVRIRLTPTTTYYRPASQESGIVLSHIPQLHKDLLEQTLQNLRDSDQQWVMQRYDQEREKMRPVGLRLVDRLIDDVNWLHDLLDHPETLTERQRRLAVAGLKYFLQEDDYVTDKKGAAGLVDDALVVEAAVTELKDIERRKSQGD